jgi:hypothetical protein
MLATIVASCPAGFRSCWIGGSLVAPLPRDDREEASAGRLSIDRPLAHESGYLDRLLSVLHSGGPSAIDPMR